jgi:hypothetical protein
VRLPPRRATYPGSGIVSAPPSITSTATRPVSTAGRPLLKRKDGTPRQHAYNKCPGKNGGFKIEREFVKNMTEREMR